MVTGTVSCFPIFLFSVRRLIPESCLLNGCAERVLSYSKEGFSATSSLLMSEINSGYDRTSW